MSAPIDEKSVLTLFHIGTAVSILTLALELDDSDPRLSQAITLGREVQKSLALAYPESVKVAEQLTLEMAAIVRKARLAEATS